MLQNCVERVITFQMTSAVHKKHVVKLMTVKVLLINVKLYNMVRLLHRPFSLVEREMQDNRKLNKNNLCLAEPLVVSLISII